jgi:hypothetical protein
MAYEELIEAVTMIVDEYVGKAPYNYIVDGVITDVDNTAKLYTVEINQVNYEKVGVAHFNNDFQIGDQVYVIIMNNNFSHKLILGKNGNAVVKGKLDYFNLPTTPVRIHRIGGDPKGKAYRFDYAFEGHPVEYNWKQVLHRRDDQKVYMITQYYSDDTVLYFYLLRNAADRVEYYGENPLWQPD